MARSSLRADAVGELDSAGFAVLRSILRAHSVSPLGAAFQAALTPPSLRSRGPKPGRGTWTIRARGEPFYLVATLWLLDDFTPANGASRVVSGSHMVHGPLAKHFADPAAHHPGEVLVRAQAGDVVTLHGHSWHSGTRSCSRGHRRVLQVTFASRAIPLLTPCPHAPADPLPTAVRQLVGI